MIMDIFMGVRAKSHSIAPLRWRRKAIMWCSFALQVPLIRSSKHTALRWFSSIKPMSFPIKIKWLLHVETFGIARPIARVSNV